MNSGPHKTPWDVQLGKLFAEADSLREAGQLGEARRVYLEALALDPRHGPSLTGLGSIAQQTGHFDIAEKMMRRAMAAGEKGPAAYFGLGAALQAQGRLDEALAAFREVLALEPSHRLARFRVGNVLQLEGRLDEAAAAYGAILKIEPHAYDAELNIGNVLRLAGRLDEARRHYERALEMKPGDVDVVWNLALLDLLEGDYASGWRRYEARLGRPTPNLRAFRQPQWKGEPLRGRTILIHAEQGLGDTLQFLRYVPLVRDAGGQVVLDVQPEIRRLAETIAGVAAVAATGEPLPEFELQCPLMSLPLAFGTKLETIPAEIPYLTVPEDALAKARSLNWPEDALRVGLVWGATPRSFEDADRSVPLALFDPILQMRGVRFYSLQVGPAAAQLEMMPRAITDLRPWIGDFADTAALLMQLDLVITVDTSVTHVAGALGKPTWVLLPFSADWRWLVNRSDSPWYPSVRLFRQAEPRSWAEVIDRVQGELASMAKNRN